MPTAGSGIRIRVLGFPLFFPVFHWWVFGWVGPTKVFVRHHCGSQSLRRTQKRQKKEKGEKKSPPAAGNFCIGSTFLFKKRLGRTNFFYAFAPCLREKSSVPCACGASMHTTLPMTAWLQKICNSKRNFGNVAYRGFARDFRFRKYVK